MERVIGIDFGTSTSVIRTKIYDDTGKPVGQELFAQPVVFNNGASMVPTIIRRKKDLYTFGYEAEIPSRNSEVFRSFKIDLQSDDSEKKETGKKLTEKYFEYLYSEYKHQEVTGFLGDPNTPNTTFLSYPVKWETATREFMIQTAKAAGFENVIGMDEAEAAIRAVSVQCRDVLRKEGLLFDGVTSNVLLIDMGAGTTDIVICKYTPGEESSNEILTTWPKGGEILFGGQEMDVILKEYIISKFPLEFHEQIKNKISIDKIKAWKENTVSPALKKNCAVTECGDAENIASFMDIFIDEFCLDRGELERLFEDYITQFIQLVAGAIIDSELKPDDIDLVVLTGGHSKWYFVEEILSGKLPKFGELNLKKIYSNPKRILSVALPQETVALGMVYCKLSGTLAFNKAEHLWKTYLETGSISALQEAADLELPDAMNELAFRYGKGNGLTQNRELAIELYNKAIKSGHGNAYYNLGCCYLEEKKYEEAFNCFSQATSKDIPAAFNNLGVCYRYGLGTEKNLEKALEHYKRSFDLGYLPAKRNYQELYSTVFPDKIPDTENSLQEVLEFAKECLSTPDTPQLYIEDIPPQKIQTFIRLFPGADISDSQLLCFYDDTFFGSGKNGFLLTTQKLYWRNFLGSSMQVNLKEITQFIITDSNTIAVCMENGQSYVLPFMYRQYTKQMTAFLVKVLDWWSSKEN